MMAIVLISNSAAVSGWMHPKGTMGADSGFAEYRIDLLDGNRLAVENEGAQAGTLSGAKIVRINGGRAELVAKLPQVCTLSANPSANEYPVLNTWKFGGQYSIGNRPILDPAAWRKTYGSMVAVKTLVPVQHGDTLMITNGAGAFGIQKI